MLIHPFVLALAVGCDDQTQAETSNASTKIAHPSDPSADGLASDFVLPLPKPEPSMCGAKNDWQGVESYDGSLGPTRGFVDDRERAVGQIRWRDDLADLYSQPGDVSGRRWCTGTLVSRNLLLTAGHCFNMTTAIKNGWTPPKNLEGEFLTPAEAAVSMIVEFNYQDDPEGAPRLITEHKILKLREWEEGGIDYAVAELAGNPGLRWGVTSVSRTVPVVGSPLSIIQHPQGLPKVIESGVYKGKFDGMMWYDDIDTQGGSSGSGVLNAVGELVGVHTQGGCEVNANKAEPINDVLGVSDVLDDLVDGDIPLVGDLDGDGAGELVIWRQTTHRWYARRVDGTRIFQQGAEPEWGTDGDIPLLADMDGDGDDEMVIWRPSTGRWYGLRSNQTRIFPAGTEPAWGLRGDVPMLGDIDGDGSDDMVVWRPSNGHWYGLRTDKTRIFPKGDEPVWGIRGDVPMLGDVDGDGVDDLVQWRTSNFRWYGLRTDGTRLFPKGDEPVWGASGDIPILTNLDGAGGDDLVVWRPTNGRWFGKRFDGTRIFPAGDELMYGIGNDVPMQGDFNGDGADDAVLWRPSNATWWARSVGGATIVANTKWGIPY